MPDTEPNRFRRFLQWLGWLLWGPNSNEYGSEQAYQGLNGLLTILIATGASYAIAVNQIPGAETAASFFYLVISCVVVYLAALTISSPTTTNGTTTLRYDQNSIRYGRVIKVLAVFLAVSFILLAKLGWFPGQRPQRRDYTAIDIPIAKPSLASLPAPNVSVGGLFQDPVTEDSQLVERFKRWFSFNNSKPETDEIIVLEQYPAFDDDYNTFSAAVLFRPAGVEFQDALVFLRRRMPASGGGAVKYKFLDWRWGDKSEVVPNRTELEQLRMPRNQSGRPYPVITIPKPNEGDSLLILLKFTARANTKLESDPNWFQLQLRRVQR